MAQETEKYLLGYFEAGDTTNVPEIERERWLTVDRQLLGLFEVLGNGLVSGWQLVTSDDTALTITVTPGSGHIDYVVADTQEATILDLTASAKNYIYAGIDVDTYYTGYTRFLVTTTTPGDSTLLYLGYVQTNAATSTTKIDEINMDGRQNLGFREALLDLLKEHRHIGGSDSPSKIDLETDVQGFLQPGNMADLDASLILRGVIDKNRLPKIDHIEDLVNQGILTHAQLDTYAQLLEVVGSRLMGEISTVNLLKLVLSLKHIYSTIDEYMVNEIAYIPGISPDTFVDKVNTTAVVDYRTAAAGGTHTITGTPSDSTETYTKAWDEKAEFDEAERSGTVVYGASIMVATLENRAFVDDFENVSDWQTQVTDISDVSATFYTDSTQKEEGDSSGKLSVGSEDSESVLLLSKSFDPQDWRGYEKLVFSIYTDSAEHGDVYFYLADADAGSQNSHKIVLERNQATIDEDGLTVGWREIVVDISQYTRENINFVGFYVSTSSGWETDVAFFLNVDNMFASSGNIFRPSGTANFTFGNDFQHSYSSVRWDALLPDDTALRVRTRVSNHESLLTSASWSSYMSVSGSQIELPSSTSLYRYIEIQVLFESDTDRKASPQLMALMLDSTVAADDFSFDFDSSDTWKSGTLHNINADRVEGSITVNYADDLGSYVLGTDGSVKQLNSDLTSRLSLYGTSAPKSYIQMAAAAAAGFGQVSSVDFGVDGTFILADTENDRILEIDRSGNVVWGLMGAYPTAPINPYDETYTIAPYVVDTATTTDDTTVTEEKTLAVVGCYYNVSNSRLSIMFNDDLANIYTTGNLDVTKFVMKSGTRRIYLGEDNSTVVLFGVDREHADISTLTTEFFQSSSILLVDLAQADAVTINNVAESTEPTLVISSPNINDLLAVNSVTAQFVVSNTTFGTDCGIRLVIDGANPVDIYDVPNYSITALTNGTHTIVATLIDMSGNVLTGSAATSTVTYAVSTVPYTAVHLDVVSPFDNQFISSDELSVQYVTYNVPAGSKLKYSVDSGAPTEYTGVSPMVISDLESGTRSIRVFLTDSSDVAIPGTFTSATFSVVVSNYDSVPFSLYVMEDAIKDDNDLGNLQSVVDIQITPVEIANIRAPMDARAVISDRSFGDADHFNVVAAKVGTQSYPNYYSVEGEGFLDGHSVVEYTGSGVIAATVNDAIIARNVSDALSSLGSVEKGNSDEYLIGDAIGRRAIVSVVDTTTKTSSVVWEYESDRLISDFARVPNTTAEITVSENSLPATDFYIRRDTPVTWINGTTGNIRILSGSTTPAQFAADPDVSLYGSDFDSGVIAPGESYTYRMLNFGTFYFFVWPQIYVGSIYVSENPVSPQDKFVIAENDPIASSYTSRVVMVDAWGNVEWSFGEALVRKIKDARPVSDTEVVVTV